MGQRSGSPTISIPTACPMRGGRFGSWALTELPAGCSVLWSLQRWLWHHRDTRLCGFAATHLSWAVQTVTVQNSLPLGVRGSRGESRFSAQAQAETEKNQSSPGQKTDTSPVVAISGIVLIAGDLQEHGEAPLGPPGSPSHIVTLWGGSCRHFLSLDVLLSAPNKSNSLRGVA